MARRLLTDLARGKGARWRIPGTGVIVIQDDHPHCPMITREGNPKVRWVMHYVFLISIGAIPLEPRGE
jgi:hypothetical protein